MGLFSKKQETLSDRIRNLRKDKGLTQLKLAEQLNITDKAVSKWEAGEGNPDISLLPKLAELFGVTIDYLLTGVIQEEKVNLDDMDKTKRAIYLVGKDDLENFKKYGYVSADYLINSNLIDKYEREQSSSIKTIREEILKVKPINIVNALLDEFITTSKYKDSLVDKISPATLVYDYLDEFVKMCALLNRVDVLEFIKFHYFAIGSKTNQQRYGRCETWQPLHTYQISTDVFTFIMENPNVKEETQKYVLTIHLFDRIGGYKYYFLNDEIIYCMYNYKKIALLEETMELLNKNNDYLVQNYVNYSLSGSYGQHKYISGNRCMFEYGYPQGPHPIGVVVPIIKAFEKAKENLDIEWIEKFNNYNSVIVNKIISCSRYYNDYNNRSSSIAILSEKDLEILKMKANPNIDDDKILVFKYSKCGLLDVKGLLNSIKAGVTTPEGLKQVIESAKRIYNNYIKKSYIHPCELIEDCITKKDYKKIFEFAVDNDIKNLIQPILEQKYDEVIGAARKLFYVPVSQRRRNSRYLTDNSELYVLLRENCDIQDETVENFILKCAEYKEDLFNNFVNETLNQIDSLTGERKIKENYDRICNEITKDYLINLLNSGKHESLIIKLCVKLEAKFQHTYKLTGEFKEMLDSYVANHMKLHHCWDDEDNDYYRYQSEDAYNTNMLQLLNKLRIVRNGIVHSSSSNESLNSKEFLQIIEFVEKI